MLLLSCSNVTTPPMQIKLSRETYTLLAVTLLHSSGVFADTSCNHVTAGLRMTLSTDLRSDYGAQVVFGTFVLAFVAVLGL